MSIEHQVQTAGDDAAGLLDLLAREPLDRLMAAAGARARATHGGQVSYSRKVFIPVTRLCRDVCAYCTFAKRPREVPTPYLSRDEVLAIARQGRAAGCHEALLTLGDRPEARYETARAALDRLGFASTVDYLVHLADAILEETGLLPHVNAGVLDQAEFEKLRAVSASQGLMLESASTRLCERGGPHFGSPDKWPPARLAALDAAGRAAVPMTSGILIGIGETRRERIESLLELRRLHRRHGHLQEVIVQNFRAKPTTRMAGSAEPGFDELCWTVAAARLILDAPINLQVPPNLSDDRYPALLAAGINDWGGVSPVTPDHVNPEAPWPQIEALAAATRRAGLVLVPRLPLYPAWIAARRRWLDERVGRVLDRHRDLQGFARDDGWVCGETDPPPLARPPGPARRDATVERIVADCLDGRRPGEAAVATLLSARGDAVWQIVEAADGLRRRLNGDIVSYVVNRNLNYTNICLHACSFCAFSKGRSHDDLRGQPYDLDLGEVARRAAEAWARGATEVCMQGGIHPRYTGDTYLALLQAVRDAAPGLHVHAFSPLEVAHGAESLGLPIAAYLERLRDAGLGSLPGTAAEILDDAVRAEIAPGKMNSRAWLDIIATAHRVGLRTTATIMFGHVEDAAATARHLLRLRDLQAETGGFTEFVPLPFVHREAPMIRRGHPSRHGPTWREVVLMHAVSRLVLSPAIPHVQASWVKVGPAGLRQLLAAGVDDLGGTLMNESISRAAGASHGQEFAPAAVEALIRAAGRQPRQRTTLYADVPAERRAASHAAVPLTPIVLTPPRRRTAAAAPERTR